MWLSVDGSGLADSGVIAVAGVFSSDGERLWHGFIVDLVNAEPGQPLRPDAVLSMESKASKIRKAMIVGSSSRLRQAVIDCIDSRLGPAGRGQRALMLVLGALNSCVHCIKSWDAFLSDIKPPAGSPLTERWQAVWDATRPN